MEKLTPHQREISMQVLTMLWVARILDEDEFVRLADAINDLYINGSDHEIGGYVR